MRSQQNEKIPAGSGLGFKGRKQARVMESLLDVTVAAKSESVSPGPKVTH